MDSEGHHQLMGIIRTITVVAATGTCTAALAAAGPASASSPNQTTTIAGRAAAATCVGTVKVIDAETSRNLGRLGRYGNAIQPTTDRSAWMRVQPTAAALSGDNVGDMRIVGTKDLALGGQVGSYSSEPRDEMQTGTADNLYFQARDAGEAPNADGATTMWKLRSRTGVLRVVWTQPDGAPFKMSGYYTDGGGYAGVAADISAFDATNGGSAQPVGFTFVPQRGSIC